jgi:hypothetical protein
MDTAKLNCEACEVPGLSAAMHNRGLMCKHCRDGFRQGTAAASAAILEEKQNDYPSLAVPVQFGYWNGIEKAAEIAAGVKVDEKAGVQE